MLNILNTYKLSELKKIVSATNIKGYSKLTKPELIKLMMREENIDRFKSIKPKSDRLPPVSEDQTKPKIKVLRELKRKFPAYKKYIQFYEKSGFTKPTKLPAPPKWLLEGKPPPANFKIPKIIITEIESETQAKPQAKPQAKAEAKPQPAPKKDKKAPELPLIVRKNKELKKLYEGRTVKTMKTILAISQDLIEQLESDSAKTVAEARFDLEDEDDLVKRTISILEPELYLKSISIESDPTGLKEKLEEKREKEQKEKAKKEKAKAK